MLVMIFETILSSHLRIGVFAKTIQSLCTPLIKATLNIYTRSMHKLLPTPTKSHYMFNLRDFARVVQGIMMLNASALPSDGDGAVAVFKRLWVHEVFRVFYDRLVDNKDREWLLAEVSWVSASNHRFRGPTNCKKTCSVNPPHNAPEGCSSHAKMENSFRTRIWKLPFNYSNHFTTGQEQPKPWIMQTLRQLLLPVHQRLNEQWVSILGLHSANWCQQLFLVKMPLWLMRSCGVASSVTTWMLKQTLQNGNTRKSVMWSSFCQLWSSILSIIMPLASDQWTLQCSYLQWNMSPGSAVFWNSLVAMHFWLVLVAVDDKVSPDWRHSYVEWNCFRCAQRSCGICTILK